jgi:HEAT repeat protein
LPGRLIERLCDFARRSSPGDCELIIRMLSGNDSPCVEEMLIALVASADLIVAGAAIETLGLVGTAAAIAPLADRFSDPFLGEPARAALKQVRARTGAGKAGETGRVSLAPSDAQAGAVSVVADEGELELLPPGRE